MKAQLFDAGSKLQIVPWMDVPGMQEAYFRGLDMEYQFPGDLQNAINQSLRETPLTETLLPWPQPFPGRCWIDWTPRYEGEDGGLQIETFRLDQYSGDLEPVPANLAQLEDDTDYRPIVTRASERMEDMLTVDEIQDRNDHPTEWLRLPLRNEQGGSAYGYCQLEQPISLVQDHHSGDEYRININYSPLFAPVDCRHPEWYRVVRTDGSPAQSIDVETFLSLRPDGYYKLYLRPANWRWVATVWANYIYVSFFEMFYTRQVFTTAYFDRPPIYPRRHDLIHTTQVADFEYLGTLYSTDTGIDWAFNSSRGAAFLRHQIIDSQWWTYSEAFIFTGNDPATLAMWLWPPEAGDIVLGIGKYDPTSGFEEVLWLEQLIDLTDEYPRTVTGSYIVLDFTVTN
jgi:hypothetical protein